MRSESSTGSMVVAFDGSPSALAALNWAIEKAPLLHLEIHLVHIWEYSESSIDIAAVGFGSAGYVGEGDPKSWSEQILSHGLSSLAQGVGEGIRTDSIEGGVVKTLVELSKEAQLMVMGSRGHGKLADLILGSVSESCSAKSKCPVVIVHAPAASI
jgi:nucleotide-binding universal stress UspA family protein